MKNKFLLILVLSSLLVIQLWFLFVTFNNAYYGVELDKSPKNEWVITGFDENISSLTLGLQIGDILIKVDGKAPNNYGILVKFHSLEQADEVTVLRNGVKYDIAIKHTGRLNIDYISLFAEIICFCIASLIRLKIPASRSARYLSLVFLLMGIVCMSIPASAREDILAKMLVYVPVAASPIVFLHFLMIFFKEKCNIRMPIKAVYGLYSLVAIKAIISLSFFTPYLNYGLYRSDKFGVILFFLFGLLINLIMLVHIDFKYRKLNPSVKPIIKFVWFAFSVSCAPLAVLSFIPMVLVQKPIIEPIYTCFFILLFPICFTYLIVTKQLFDVQIITRRIVYTTLISMVPSIIIVVLQGFIFNQTSSIQKLLFSFLLILTIISFLLYLLEYFVTKLDSIMFPRKYHLQMALKKIAQNLSTIRSFRELKDIILVDIINTLQVYGGAIVFEYQNDLETIGWGGIDLKRMEQAFISGALNESAYSIFEINQNEEYASYLIITKKKNNTLLGLEETQWLSLIISYLAVSLENLYLIRKLTMRLHELASQIPNELAAQDFVWLRKSLFELQERERFRIATELHDTTLQDILLIKKRLIAYRDNGEDRQQLMGIIKHLDLVNDSLRQSCFELNPYLLQRIGLVKTIEAAIELDMGSNDFETNFYVEGAEAIESVDIEMKKHVFRIVQELIQNAKKHSNASKVSLKLTVMEGYLCLFYSDDGVGMDAKIFEGEGNLRTAAISGLGLDQMKSRIIYLNGHLELVSKTGHGVAITVRLPNLKGVAV
jgi:two-component system, NarL family, sensor histidine kinase ComP